MGARVRPRLAASAGYRLHRLLASNAVFRGFARWVERRPRAYSWFAEGERVAKEALFGCRMCGQCALPVTGYTCPMTCPKRLRNGPCGGVSPAGMCEVEPELRCVWVVAFERAEAAGRRADLDRLHRPVDHRQRGRSSWVNYWRGRDAHLWSEPAATRPPLGIGVGDGR
ncbi:methylenetetrahydrofolate reductase C-terminal domain-containing protein [Pseudonocardia acaciae]|uniref:methylenetetrahydrofolate reductase C-terminal domain-containing protein n=1 Tax=Pseudonocardia acaciae TaxID=551276 RepID=UPI000A0464BA|nr:methylenetetrahydrofolate reductase C-terminal domain-containing protein [Pseudonocardia acaciae]